MPGVFGIHMVELNPGVKAEDFERFVVEEVLPHGFMPGVEQHLLKGDRGDQEGKYAVLFVFESIQSRDRWFPSPEQASEEAERHLDSLRSVLEKWAAFAPFPPAVYTDYVVVER